MVSTGTINHYTITVLTTKQIKANLKAVANWSQREQSICRMFKFEGFLNSVAFVNHIAL
jgi:pterin-4a-carbinolamine dehydratase